MQTPIEKHSKPFVATIIFIFPYLISDPEHIPPIMIPKFVDVYTISHQ